MTALLANGNEDEMLLLYRRSTRLVVCMVASLTLVLALFPGEAILVWTGNPAAAAWAAPVLPLFISGSGLLAVGAFQYYLQYAHGRLRLHVIYNTGSVMISVPLITYAAFQHGALGVAWVWFGFRLFSLLVWTPYIHFRFAPGIHRDWLLRDVVVPALAATIVLAGLAALIGADFPAGRGAGLAVLGGATLLAMVAAFAAAFWDDVRGRINAKVRL